MGLYGAIETAACGVFAGFIGIYYLSLGALGKTAMGVLTPLLPATSAAIGGAFALWVLDIVFPPTPIRLAALRQLDDIFAVMIAIILFAYVYGLCLVVRYALRRQPGQPDVATLRRTLVVMIPVLLFVTSLSSIHTNYSLVYAVAHATIPGLVAVVISLPVVAVLFLPERRLLVVGMALTALAVIMQFILPMLDLLNISVK